MYDGCLKIGGLWYSDI